MSEDSQKSTNNSQQADLVDELEDQKTSTQSSLNLEEKIKNLEEELKKEKNEQLYLRADFDNYKKRVLKERADLLKYGSERAFVQLLEVLDNFERALNVELSSENFSTFKQGVEMIAEQFKDTLKRLGVEEYKSQDFDPNYFEAISTEASEDVEPGKISRVFKKAYKLHDKLIRPGQVVIAVEKKVESKNDSSDE